ncbi:MAG TPA: MFS transporter [Syntrophales bacterium]|nr:MFS transporter [Syntrophales bacterium]
MGNPEEASAGRAQASRYGWVIVGTLWLVHVLNFMNFSSFGILAPLVKEDLRLSSFQIGFLISALSIGSVVFQMPAGLVVDFVGVRRMLTLAVVGIGLFLTLFSLAPSFLIGLAVLILYGGANGIVGPAASKCVLDWFPTVGRATAMGFKQTGVNFGGIFAGILLPAIVMAFTWRQGLLAIGIVEMAAAIPIYLLLRESPVRLKARRTSSLAWGKIARMALQRNMLILSGIGFCFIASQFCFSTYLILFLTQEMKYPLVEAGYYYALSFFAGAVARVLWSVASDYLLSGRRKGVLALIALILLLSSLVLVMISFFPVFSPLLIVTILAFGMSGIGWNAIYLTILGESTDRESTALATGIGYAFGFLGSLVAPPLFGLLADRTGTYGWAWLLVALCAAAILVLLIFHREKRHRDPTFA